jgi:hypothetical protein
MRGQREGGPMLDYEYKRDVAPAQYARMDAAIRSA